jgi:small-conductance mechanosensitive channel
MVLLALTAGVLVLYDRRRDLGVEEPIRLAAVGALVLLSWTIGRDAGQVARPLLFRRLGAQTASTVSFLIHLATMAVMAFVALNISGATSGTIAVGSTVAAVIFGLAAQQSLSHVIAGGVLVSTPVVRVGERVRLQGGGIAGRLEGVVSSLGLLYTTLVGGESPIMVPNSVILSLAVRKRRAPQPVQVRAHVRPGLRPETLQRLLDEAVRGKARSAPDIGVEAVEGGDVLVRVAATPDRATERLALEDDILSVLAQAADTRGA